MGWCQVLLLGRVEVLRIDRQMHAMIADVQHLNHVLLVTCCWTPTSSVPNTDRAPPAQGS